MSVIKKLDARMTLNLPQHIKETIQKLAFQNKVSDSAFVLAAVEEHLKRINGAPDST